MYFVLSPAKNLNEAADAPLTRYTQPQLLSQAEVLMPVLRQLAPQDMAKLMGVSDKIALLNTERNDNWQPPFTLDNAKQAVFTYFYRQTSENECAATVENSAHHYGLGLTVATELANLQHGSLTVQDTPGGGASFCLVLPAKQHT